MKMHTSRTKAKSTRVRRRQTNEEITAATRRRLIAAGRRLFATRGYDATSADLIGDAAGLTRGALHYQFGDKRGLFVAVLEAMLAELVVHVAEGTMKDAPEGPEELERGAALLLEAYGVPEIQRVLLQDAPHVLGWQAWLQLQERSGLAALLDHALEHWVEAGWMEAALVAPTRRLLFGALVHAGVAIAEGQDREAALASFREPLRRLIRGMAPAEAAPGRPRVAPRR